MIYDPCKWNGPMHCHQKRALTVSNDQTQQQKKKKNKNNILVIQIFRNTINRITEFQRSTINRPPLWTQWFNWFSIDRCKICSINRRYFASLISTIVQKLMRLQYKSENVYILFEIQIESHWMINVKL